MSAHRAIEIRERRRRVLSSYPGPDCLETAYGGRAGLLPADATVADPGCGIGLPATRALTGHRLRVIGVDFSAVQLARAS